MKPPAITTIIFDWGGTCTAGDVMAGLATTLAVRTGVPERRILRAFERNKLPYLLGRMPGEVFWARFAADAGIRKPPGFFIRLFLAAGRADPRMLALARRLRKRYKVGLVSDSVKELADWTQRAYRLDNLFDVAVFSNRVGVKKPAARMFRIALKLLRARPEECLFIDDKAANVAAARQLGMRAIRFGGEAKLKKALAKVSVEGV